LRQQILAFKTKNKKTKTKEKTKTKTFKKKISSFQNYAMFVTTNFGFQNKNKKENKNIQE
jgi:hypothetical protein